MTLSCEAVYEFGTKIKTNILETVGTTRTHSNTTMVIEVAYLIGFVCHIPYVFFSGKESFLIMFDEIFTRRLSESIEKSLGK